MKNEIHEKTLTLDEFAPLFKRFCKRHQLSDRNLETLMNCKNASKTSMCRLRNGTIRVIFYHSLLGQLERVLENFLESAGFSGEQIDLELTKLFPYRSERQMITNRCVLPATAINFFNLKCDPFDVDKVPTEDELFTNSELDSVVMRAKDAVIGNQLMAIIGDVGTGKTSLKVRIARELTHHPEYDVKLLYPEFFDMGDVKVGAIARYLLEEFDTKCPTDSIARVRKIKQLLTSLRNENVRIGLIFDECHRLNDKVVSSLKNFWEMTNGAYDRLLSIILFGQPKFIDSTLRDPRFREIAERMQVIQMPKIQKSALAYLTHKLTVAGGNIDELFEPEAVDKIIRVGKTPLALGNIANESLIEAFELGQKTVEASMLKIPEMPKLRGFRQAA